MTKKSGETFEFKVDRVTDKEIIGEEMQVSFDEINRIQKKEVSPVKTTGLVVGIIVVVVAGVVVVFWQFVPPSAYLGKSVM